MIKEIVEFMDANEGIEEYFIQDEVSNAYFLYYIKINKDIVCRDLLDIDNLDRELKDILKYMTYYQKGMHNKYLTKDYGLGGSSPYILTIIVNYDGNSFTTNIKDTKIKKRSKKTILNKKYYKFEKITSTLLTKIINENNRVKELNFSFNKNVIDILTNFEKEALELDEI